MPLETTSHLMRQILRSRYCIQNSKYTRDDIWWGMLCDRKMWTKSDEHNTNINAEMDTRKTRTDHIRNEDAEMDTRKTWKYHIRNVDAEMDTRKTRTDHIRNVDAETDTRKTRKDHIRNVDAEMDTRKTRTDHIRNVDAEMDTRKTRKDHIRKGAHKTNKHFPDEETTVMVRSCAPERLWQRCKVCSKYSNRRIPP